MKKFTVGHQLFRSEISQKTGMTEICSIHPYDETKYHWARKNPSTDSWEIYRDGKYIYTKTVNPSLLNSYQTEEDVIARTLLKLDNEAHLKRTGGIW